MKGAYLDNASATPVRKEVLEAMLPYFSEQFGNPSNVYDLGTKVKAAMEAARTNVATLIGADPPQIIFTSSGAEFWCRSCMPIRKLEPSNPFPSWQQSAGKITLFSTPMQWHRPVICPLMSMN
ncbi:MAG: aminotransferase class V-fold PLP-dependent enzyme [Desulfobacterales bacterium]